MRGFVAGLDKAIGQTVRSTRASSDWTEALTIEPSTLIELEPIQELLKAHVLRELDRGATRAEAFLAADFLGNYTFPLLNFELHRRKLFWVDASLAWMLLQTRLDIEGAALKLPFPSLGFVFTDGASLDLAKALLVRAGTHARTAQVLTVYVTRVAAPGDAVGINLSFFFDARDGEWPFLVARDLFVRPGDKLDGNMVELCLRIVEMAAQMGDHYRLADFPCDTVGSQIRAELGQQSAGKGSQVLAE